MKKMKKSLLLTMLLLLAFPSFCPAQESGPNVKESVDYFTNYFNESVVQILDLQKYIKKEKLDRDEQFFLLEIISKLENSVNLAFNLRDLYYIYGRTMYCYAKEERKFVLDRIGNVLVLLNNMLQAPYFGMDPEELEGDGYDARNAAKCEERLKKLVEFIEKSSAIFK